MARRSVSRPNFRFWSRAVSLGAFVFMLGAVSAGLPAAAPDIFLRLDPALALVTAVCDRSFALAFVPALLVVLAGPFLGRAFCGHICPMGTTIDWGDHIISGSKKKNAPPQNLRPVKFFVLAFALGASVFGISLIFIASPLSLATRFYGLLAYPVAAFLIQGVLEIIRPVADSLDLLSIAYASVDIPRFSTQLFILVFFVLVFASAKLSPRFWCRYVCPSGALLALVSKKPAIRREVNPDCTSCGKCAKTCPMNAIDADDPFPTAHAECIVCRKCESVCPVGAVDFPIGRSAPKAVPEIAVDRRRFIKSGFAGAGTAVVCLTGLNAPHGKKAEGRVDPPGLVRPPGAVPDPAFLSLCVRCGECMAACPTNTLQPLWLTAGFIGMFSPALVPRRGFCDPKCNSCGRVCPTGAIRHLDLKERTWAKTGTAAIMRHTCLAWEHQKACMVCDEVCPFDAVEFMKEPGNPVPVPHVIENKCAGCGYCEHFCPVRNRAAIVVTPMGALRLAGSESHETVAKGRGLVLRLKPRVKEIAVPETQILETAPGFDDG